ncbi:hypothetical protein [Streptomyces sp. NPDC059651]|uniref:hypothetical protein n=1 Tax=Streptomyces sp. NPDC059651 TaxID=3346897 RepID=UPI003681B6A8
MMEFSLVGSPTTFERAVRQIRASPSRRRGRRAHRGHRDGAGTAPVTFVPVDGTEAFADAVLGLLAGHSYGRQQADTRQLTQEWDTYRGGFLAITAAACGSPRLDTLETTPV